MHHALIEGIKWETLQEFKNDEKWYIISAYNMPPCLMQHAQHF